MVNGCPLEREKAKRTWPRPVTAPLDLGPCFGVPVSEWLPLCSRERAIERHDHQFELSWRKSIACRDPNSELLDAMNPTGA